MSSCFDIIEISKKDPDQFSFSLLLLAYRGFHSFTYIWKHSRSLMTQRRSQRLCFIQHRLIKTTTDKTRKLLTEDKIHSNAAEEKNLAKLEKNLLSAIVIAVSILPSLPPTLIRQRKLFSTLAFYFACH